MRRGIEGGAGVGIGLVASALGALGAPAPVWVLVLVVGIGLIAHAFTATGDRTEKLEDVTRPPVVARTRAPSPKRRVLAESAFDLQRPFRDHGTVEAELKTSLYIGSWVKAEGYVAEPTTLARAGLGEDVALCRRPNTVPRVFLSFAKSEPKRQWRAGEKVYAEGEVTEIGPWRVVLSECVPA